MSVIFQAAIGLIICACVMIAPNISKRTAVLSSVAFSLMAGMVLAVSLLVGVIA